MRKSRETQKKQILNGYKKLAFGSVADAVRLLFSEEPDLRNLDEMDLFNIAEIKRPKGGGMEIKFFDRIKALQCMQDMDNGSGEVQAGFYHALQNGAVALAKDALESQSQNEGD